MNAAAARQFPRRTARPQPNDAWRVAVAPMMGCTDRHFRYLARLLSEHVMLYTEMLTCNALLRGDTERLLAYHPAERPLALQVGGCDPEALAACAAMAEAYGYDEINLNAGCPSARVCAGGFGAQLFTEPGRAAECVAAMRSRTSLSVTVKTRIGVDERDSPEHLEEFARRVFKAGCRSLILHARKAWLKGVNPRRNRTLPPLREDRVYALKERFPEARIIFNGGIRDLSQADRHLEHVDGVMLGRAAYRDSMLLAQVDQHYHDPGAPLPSRSRILQDYRPHVARELALGTPPARFGRHLGGLLRGLPGARACRRLLCTTPADGTEAVLQRYDELLRRVRDADRSSGTPPGRLTRHLATPPDCANMRPQRAPPLAPDDTAPAA